jgi:hypothetical protein
MKSLSRRHFLKGSAVAVGASSLSFGALFGVSAQSEGDDPATILNLAATAETFACVHYYNAIMSADALGLTEEEVGWLKSFLDSELQHKLFLEANGAVPVATEFYVPGNLFTDRNVFVQTTNTAENWFVAAYLAATRRFAELGESQLAATTAQVSGVEAEHQALIRLMGGLQPSFQTLKEPLFWNTSEVVPLFTPFLDGSGEGFVGPAAFPGVDEIAALVAGFEVEAVTPFIQLDGMGTLNMMAAGGGAAAAEATAETPADASGEDTTGSDNSDGGDDSMADNSDGEDTMGDNTDGGEDTTGGDDSTLGDAVNDVVDGVDSAVDTLLGGNND